MERVLSAIASLFQGPWRQFPSVSLGNLWLRVLLIKQQLCSWKMCNQMLIVQELAAAEEAVWRACRTWGYTAWQEYKLPGAEICKPEQVIKEQVGSEEPRVQIWFTEREHGTGLPSAVTAALCFWWAIPDHGRCSCLVPLSHPGCWITSSLISVSAVTLCFESQRHTKHQHFQQSSDWILAFCSATACSPWRAVLELWSLTAFNCI